MRDFLDIALRTLVGLVIFQLGVWFGKRQERSKKPVEKDLSICSCRHQYSMHQNDGKCRVAISVKKYNKRGDFVGRDHTSHSCACQRYDGVPPAHIFMKEQ